jgi:hypothetical protein
MLVRICLIAGILLLAMSEVQAQSATVTSTSSFCETQNQTPDKYINWSGTWSNIPEGYVVVGCYAPVYGSWSPTTYYSPGPAIGAPAPTSSPGGSSGSESPIVPIPGPDGGTLQGAYVWFEYGNWVAYSGQYYWIQEGVLCSWVWVPAASGGCFAAGTMVLTPSGYQPIQSLKVGDSVISARRATPDANRTAQRIRRVSQHSES